MTKQRATHPIPLTLALTLGLLAAGCLAACGGEVPEDFGSQEASQTAQALTSASGQAQKTLSTELGKLGQQQAKVGPCVSGTIGLFTISCTIQNPGGGSATLSGSGGKGTTGLWDVSMTATFSNWVDASTGMTINGPAHLALDLDKLLPLSSVATATTKPEQQLKVTPQGFPLPVPVVVDLTMTVAGTSVSICGVVAGQTVQVGSCP